MIHALAAATLVAFAFLPQDPKPGPIRYPKAGTLVLPKPTSAEPRTPSGPEQGTPKTEAQDAAAALLEEQRFETALARLRRGVLANEGATEIELRRLGEEFPNVAELGLRILKRAEQDQVPALARALRRFGRAEHCDTIQLALLTRSYGAATADLVQAFAALAGDARKPALLRLVEGPYVPLQVAARDEVAPLLVPADVPALVALSRSKKLEPATRGLELLGAVPAPEARVRLVEAMAAPEITFAQAAVQALLGHGQAAVPDLLAIVEKPAVDFRFAWAAFLLSQIEERSGEACLTPACVPQLIRELTTPEPFFQVTAALALARVAWRSQDTTGEIYRDAQVVDALLQVVAPRAFVVGYAQLERPVTRTLAWFTGQDMRGAEAWRSWWKIARDGYVGMRMRLAIDAHNAGLVTIVARDARGEWRTHGEQVRTLPEGQNVSFCVLDTAAMQAFVARLTTAGFMAEPPRNRGAANTVEALPAQRVTLEVGKARAATGFLAERVLEQLVTEVQRTTEAERWQLYRDPRKDGDFGTFWKTERAWLAQNTESRVRDARLKDRIVTLLPRLEGAARERAVDHLTTIADVGKLVGEDDGLALAAAAAASPQLDDTAFRLLELALIAPGEKAWRRVLDVIDERFERGGKERLPRAFGLLGADKVLLAIDDARPRIRLAATSEVANTKDLRAVPRLLDLVVAADADLRHAAIFSLGKLRASAARERLLQELPRFDAATRRVAWVALGRIGGEDVLVALRSAVVQPDEADRHAAIQALGELKDPEASRLLAEIWARSQDARTSDLAMVWLRRHGAILARPALRPWLKSIDLRQRREILTVLAEMQDPEVVPHLLQALSESPSERGTLIAHVAVVTGVDLSEINDRTAYLREWWRTHEAQPQAAWFLELLQQEHVDTSLRIVDLEPRAGAAAIPELVRIMTRSTNPRVRQLALAMLRQVSDQDFGPLPLHASDEAVRAVADRYRFWAEVQQAARK